MDNELSKRLFWFAVNTIKYLKTPPNSIEITVIKYQLSKSSFSAGANYEEAQGASSRADFKNKVYITLKEMRESNYWIRIMGELNLGQTEGLNKLLGESEELKKILGSITSKMK